MPLYSTAVNPPSYIGLVTGAQATTFTDGVECGLALLDPSLFDSNGRTIKFIAQLETSTAQQTVTLVLYNLTDGVTITALSTTNTTPTKCSTAALAVPGVLPNSEKLYSVRISSSGGAQPVTCKMARFEITY